MRPNKERLEEIREWWIRHVYVPAEMAEDLLAEIDALRSDLQCRGIHTCHDQCQNPMCLMRKRVDALEAEDAKYQTLMHQKLREGISASTVQTAKDSEILRDLLSRVSSLERKIEKPDRPKQKKNRSRRKAA